MNNNKQSSVEWLIEQYKKCFGPVIPLIMNNENEKAKAMEKQSIKDAFIAGDNNGLDYYNPMTKTLTSEDYYNETYGGNK
jgi:hypothetical protein